MASRLQSSPSPFMLGSNDDQLERAQARAVRAAAIRRMSIQAANAPPIYGGTEPNGCLGRQQILELFQNCIRLASENKINQKNTWELNLIDHLTEIIKIEDEKDAETNFQKASCTLEAGVKIYSLRVDSVHSEAYKVLGGMNRAGQDEKQDEAMQKFDDYGQLPSWDEESVHDGPFDEAVVHSDAVDSSTLVSQPRQVNKIEVHYDKTSKQVDVQVLKETLWHCMQGSNRVSIQEQDSIFFQATID